MPDNVTSATGDPHRQHSEKQAQLPMASVALRLAPALAAY